MPKESKFFLFAMVLLLLSVVWFLLGAPITAHQVSGIPSQFEISFNQLPTRIGRMLSLWTMYFGEIESPAVFTQEQSPIRVYDTDLNQIVTMTLSKYLLGAVSEEMPASYHIEALKSQAIAARTKVIAQLDNGCSAHEGADICSDSSHCQGYLNEDKQKEKWGSTYTLYRDRIREAIDATKGLILTYKGAPITVLYHAVSGGMTEDAKAVFGEEVPYLKSVVSKGEEGVSSFESTQTYTNAQAAGLLNAAFPDAHLTAEMLPVQMYILTKTDSGRVSTMQLGDTTVSGRDIREALSLKSTLFTIQVNESSITFTQRGYGHGVGMSQAGANAMAATGSNYADILSYYYQGVTIAQTNEIVP